MSPLLWRIGSNSLLTKLDQIKQTRTAAFADDVNIIIYSNDESEFRRRVNLAYETVSRWCARAEITLNTGKTEAMSIGKKKIRQITIGDSTIKTVVQLKLLGIMMDNKLNWNGHLDYLKIKSEQLAINLNKTFWLNNRMALKQKRRLYRSVFLRMITYASAVWFPEIRKYRTKIEKLIRIQNRIIRIITGAYQKSNANKLLELSNQITIDKELEILHEVASQPTDRRGELKREMREDARRERERFFDLPNCQFEELKTREATWCLTGAGPFKSYLHKCGLTDEPICRFCGQADETSERLLFACDTLNLKCSTKLSAPELDNFATKLIQELRRRPL